MLSLENAPVYDVECLPNVFTLHMELLKSEVSSTWEISQFRDDRQSLFVWFDWLHRTQTPMIGFHSFYYDYPIIHYLFKNPQATNADLYAKSQALIASSNDPFKKFEQVIWDRDRFAPQIDLFKIYHMDNKAKRTSLKALQINMRSDNVVESSLPWHLPASEPQINFELIPYNRHDVKETKRFAVGSLPAIEFRNSLVAQHGVDVMNWDDTKIGEKILVQRIGEDRCFDRTGNRRVKRQTRRTSIALNEIIFPIIRFRHPEFQRVLDYMRAQTLTPADIINENGEQVQSDKIVTKGAFSGLKAHVGGVDFYFGTGGIHASVEKQHVSAFGTLKIRDIDVASLYPSIGIVNRLYPEHLGESFVEAYSSLPAERKEWQKKKGKKCPEANSMKLAGNGAYGKSNDEHSVLYDPKYTMTVTINGQLMIAMLVEWLVSVPTVQIIQANTDGITYRIDEAYLSQAVEYERQWQEMTRLVLEDAEYSDMWIRDVNNYVAKSVSKPGDNRVELKQKGAYWHPDPDRYFESVSEAQPPAWHKDLGNIISIKAAVAAMVHGIDPEFYIRTAFDKFDFMCRAKVGRNDVLLHGTKEIQKTSRYYVAKNGETLAKISPPPEGAAIGQFKRRNGISDLEYQRVLTEIGPGVWDERIHTKNKSTYQNRRTEFVSGYKAAICNDASHFDFANINYDWYLAEARKLIIA